jgi:hypothetical protein
VAISSSRRTSVLRHGVYCPAAPGLPGGTMEALKGPPVPPAARVGVPAPAKGEGGAPAAAPGPAAAARVGGCIGDWPGVTAAAPCRGPVLMASPLPGAADAALAWRCGCHWPLVAAPTAAAAGAAAVPVGCRMSAAAVDADGSSWLAVPVGLLAGCSTIALCCCSSASDAALLRPTLSCRLAALPPLPRPLLPPGPAAPSPFGRLALAVREGGSLSAANMAAAPGPNRRRSRCSRGSNLCVCLCGCVCGVGWWGRCACC